MITFHTLHIPRQPTHSNQLIDQLGLLT